LTRRLLFALLALAVGQAAVYVARPMTSYRLLGLGAGPRDVGLVTAAFALIPLFLAIPLGRRADRSRGGSLIVAGCGIEVLACLLLAAARSPLSLAGASALLGLGHLGVALGAQAVVARESSNERHDRDFGLLTAGVSLGQLAGPVLAGLIVGDRSGAELAPAASRAMLAGAAVAFVAVVFGLLAERGRPVREPASSRGAAGGSVLGIVTMPGVAAGIFASVAVLSAADVFTAYMPVLGEQRGIEPRVVGALLAIRAAASLTSRVGIGTIVRLVGRRRLIVVSCIASAAAFGALPLTRELALLAVLSAALGTALGFGQPLSMTIVVQAVPERMRATALSVRLAGNRIGQVAAPAAAGLVAGTASVGAVFAMLGGVLLLSAAAVGSSGESVSLSAVDPADAPDPP
jgi:MFS family permease